VYRIVDSLSGRTGGHVGRYLSVAIGLICLVVAFASGMVVMTLLSVVLLFAATEGELTLPSEMPDIGSIAFVAGCALLSLVMWLVGVRLIRGDRHLVLFLRKFGFTGASVMLSSAIASGLGRRWRLVTLDDHDLAPVGVGGGSRWIVRLLRLVLVAVGVYVTVQAVQWLRSDVGGDIARQTVESAVESAAAEARAQGANEFEVALNELGAAIGASIAGAMIGALVMVFVAVLFGIAISGAVTGGLMLTAVGRSARRAERAKAIVIARQSNVERACTRLRRRVDRVLAPRISVARVSDRLWQVVVRRLARSSDAVIVDISFPTDNLVWEVRSMLRARAWMIPIGRRDRLRAIAHDPAPAAVELRRLLGDREVVGYDTEHPKAFSDGLRRSLEVIRERVRARKGF
jgi:hypothetical protein